VLGRLRQEDHKFKTSLGYVVRPCLKKQKATKKLFKKIKYSGFQGYLG
jgi:hypothetical protein